MITISLIESIAHEFTFSEKDMPSDLDKTDPHAIMQWATDEELVNYENGEPVGCNDLKIVEE